MGLFSDLPSPTNPDDAPKQDDKSKSTWSVNTLKPPPSIAVKREGTTSFVHPSLIRSRGSKATPSPQDNNNNNTHLTTATIALSLSEGILEEYDPEFPNNYEGLRQSREIARREVEEEAERQERMREERIREERKAEMQLLAALDAAEEGGGGGQNTLPLPIERQLVQKVDIDGDVEVEVDIKREAVLGVSGDEAWRRRGMPSHHHHIAHPPPPPTATTVAPIPAPPPPPRPPPIPPPPIASSGGMTFAQKLMEKMGWKEGEGLGKQKQGIAAPLQVRKTADRAGIIIPGELLLLGGGGDIKDERNSRENNSRKKSRVVVVRNVVGPGEVELSLDEEIGTHCLASGYGEVEDVIVYEVIEPDDFPVEEAVRVFVKFSSAEEAGRAVDGWDGRMYDNKNGNGGRVVRVGYFDEERFDRGDLGPTEEEVESCYYGWREGGGGGGGGGRRKKKKGGRGRGRGG